VFDEIEYDGRLAKQQANNAYVEDLDTRNKIKEMTRT